MPAAARSGTAKRTIALIESSQISLFVLVAAKCSLRIERSCKIRPDNVDCQPPGANTDRRVSQIPDVSVGRPPALQRLRGTTMLAPSGRFCPWTNVRPEQTKTAPAGAVLDLQFQARGYSNRPPFAAL